MSLRTGVRAEKLPVVNEIQKHFAIEILERCSRPGVDLTPEEIAWVLIGVVSICVKNRGGNAVMAGNLRNIANKFNGYADLLDAKQATPTDDILIQ